VGRGAAYKACQVIRRMIIAPFCFVCGAIGSPLHALYLSRCVHCTSHNCLIAVQQAGGEYFRKLSAAWSEALRSAFATTEEFKL